MATKTYELLLEDLRPEVQEELIREGFADTNNNLFPIAVLEVEIEEEDDPPPAQI